MSIIKELKIVRIRLPQEEDKSWGNLRALVDVELPDKGLRINGFRVIQQDSQKAWVGAPTSTYITRDEKRVYIPLIRFLDKLEFYKLQQEILSAYERKIKEEGMLNEE